MQVLAEKCFLRHITLGNGISMDPSNIAIVKDWPVPKSMIEMWSFLGLAGCYLRFVHNFRKIVGHLMKLMMKGETYN